MASVANARKLTVHGMRCKCALTDGVFHFPSSPSYIFRESKLAYQHIPFLPC